MGWACNLFTDLIAHWAKRSRSPMERHLRPTNLDRQLLAPRSAAQAPALCQGTHEGADFLIGMLATWNGGLVMFAHGYGAKAKAAAVSARRR